MPKVQINRNLVAIGVAVLAILLGIAGISKPEATAKAIGEIVCAVADCVDDAPAAVTE